MKSTSFSFNNVLEVSPSFGVSPEADRLQSLFQDLDRGTLQSVSLGKQRTDALRQLYGAFCETCQPDWDAYGGSATSFEAYVKAEKFIKTLPANIPAPEIAIDPDGEVSLEWFRGPRQVFSVSIGPSDKLTYAGIFGASNTHGEETLNFQIPKVVLQNLRRLLA